MVYESLALVPHTVIVVSNIDLTTDASVVEPSTFLNSSFRGFVLNINNDYRYMKMGYYVSLHAEVLGDPVIPTSEDGIDAYRHPILLMRAAKAGIPTLPYIVTDSAKQMISEFGFPLMIFAVNPFSNGGFRIAQNRSALYRALRSLGLNHKYAVCVQPLVGEVVSVKSVFGKCDGDSNVGDVAKSFYEVFKLPICKLHLQRFKDKAYLCGIEPLKMEEVLPSDLRLISEEVSRISKFGEKYWLE